MNKKSAQKQKRPLITTVSRKPLFHRKSYTYKNLPKVKIQLARMSWIFYIARNTYWGFVVAAAKVQSVQESGLKGAIVDVECQLSQGLPTMLIVGLAGKSLDEAKERLRSACLNSELPLPKKKITINLAPADLPKEGSSFDLALVTSILLAEGRIQTIKEPAVFIGELGLDGTIRPVRGLIGKLLAAQQNNIHKAYIPEGNLEQAKLLNGFKIVPLKNLRSLYQTLTEIEHEKPVVARGYVHDKTHLNKPGVVFKDIVGQERAKRAFLIAAAGRHNVLLNGPPGVGKSMLAKAMTALLPPLSNEESMVVTHLHSLAEQDYETIITDRPMRAPHHTASTTSIVGGGQNPRPGEISLAHGGVLFMDELPEFRRDILESLRQPLEDKVIRVSRARNSVLYPADFILIATKNPCPCGYYGSSKPCICSPYQILQYEKKLSGPILDRIDMYVQVDEVNNAELLMIKTNQEEEASTELHKQLKNALFAQKERFKSDSKFNGNMNTSSIKKHAEISAEAKELLDSAATHLGLSARAYMRAVKVSRTIADLESSPKILPLHISEALQYRPITTQL